MLIDIDKIIIKDRIRKDYGNIEELANDIRDNGLINPPVLTPEYELIAGERRTKACKYLDYKQIEVRIMTVQDALHQLKLEISENENRKDFSFSEKMTWAEELKKEYSKLAEKNMKGGITLCPNEQKVNTRDKVANDLDMSSTMLGKAEFIHKNADEEMIKELDEGKLSINKAYNTLKDKLKQQEEKNQELRQALDREKNKPKEKEIIEIDNTDYTLINKLKEEKRNLELKVIQLQDKVSNSNITYTQSPKILQELDELKNQIKQKNKEIEEKNQLENELNEKKMLLSRYTSEDTNLDLVATTSENRKKMMDFVQEMAKYNYIAETFNDIPDASRKEWVRAVYSIYKWSKGILDVVKHDDVTGVDSNIIDADFQIN